MRGKMLYGAIIDLEKAYDGVEKEAFWNGLNISGVLGQLVEGINTQYREGNHV